MEIIEALRTKDQAENAGADIRTLRVFSDVLNREVFVTWEGEDPQSVLFDGVAYSVDEISKLKEMPLTPESLRAIHQVKATLGGELGSIRTKGEKSELSPEPVNFDDEIRGAIHELDAAEVNITSTSSATRQETLALEKEITEACNAGDVAAFREALHKWRIAWLRELH